MNGARASFARRRAISVLPTPVGPIIRMFFGVISARSCFAHLHAPPAIAQRNRHSALGGALPDDVFVELLNDFAGGHGGHRRILATGPARQMQMEAVAIQLLASARSSCPLSRPQLLDREIAIGIDADVGGDVQ